MNTLDEMHELEKLMLAARWRARHVFAIIASILLGISIRVPWRDALNPRLLVPILGWSVGCVVILVVLTIWYRFRMAAITRLFDLVHSGACLMHHLDKTALDFEHLIPIGFEVDVVLASSEHLAFGFWTEREADALIQVLNQLQMTDRDDD